MTKGKENKLRQLGIGYLILNFGVPEFFLLLVSSLC